MSEKFNPEKENILGILHKLQNNNPANFLTEKDLKYVATYLNTTYSQVYGVATYYSMFSLTPRGKHVIRVCNSPVCSMEGSEDITEMIEELLGISSGETTPDGLFSIETTSCLGQCDIAPSMMIGEDVYGGLGRDKIIGILDHYKKSE